MIRCKVCNKPIEKARIEFFQEMGTEIDTCKQHSQAPKIMGLEIYAEKTNPEVVMFNGSDKNQRHQAFREYYRAK